MTGFQPPTPAPRGWTIEIIEETPMEELEFPRSALRPVVKEYEPGKTAITMKIKWNSTTVFEGNLHQFTIFTASIGMQHPLEKLGKDLARLQKFDEELDHWNRVQTGWDTDQFKIDKSHSVLGAMMALREASGAPRAATSQSLTEGGQDI